MVEISQALERGGHARGSRMVSRRFALCCLGPQQCRVLLPQGRQGTDVASEGSGVRTRGPVLDPHLSAHNTSFLRRKLTPPRSGARTHARPVSGRLAHVLFVRQAPVRQRTWGTNITHRGPASWVHTSPPRTGYLGAGVSSAGAPVTKNRFSPVLERLLRHSDLGITGLPGEHYETKTPFA